jgi:glycosyltransferase involved in cell wall biosynthesis
MNRTDARRRIALVTPWYGAELIGGAERLAWELSHALARQRVDVDVLTTTCRSFHDDWGANYHRPGVRTVDGLTIQRFKVDSRDRAAFSRANAKLLSLPRISLRRDAAPLSERDTRAFFSDNIMSSALLAYLASRGASYDAVIFVPYLYGPTVAGVELVSERAFLIPCLHDEAYAYLNPIRAVFARACGLLFNSAGEAEVAGAIFGPAVHAKASIIGHAVEPVEPPRSPIVIGGFAPHRARYILYLGRQDRTKNVDFLIEAFRVFRERRVATSLQLVLAGPRPSGMTSRDGIIWLDTVAEDVKAALLTYARALAQPSVNESFSRAIYESWYAQRPVIVHADCRATAHAVEDSGGGWIGASIDDWVHVLTLIDESSDDAIDAVGQHGWAAAMENGSWDAVAVRTLAAIDARLDPAGRLLCVDQLVPLGGGAAAQYATALGEALRQAGVDCSTTIDGNARRESALALVHATGPDPMPIPGDAIIAHTGDAFLPAASCPPLFAANVAALQTLVERGFGARLLPMPVDPGAWASVAPARGGADDGRTTFVSISPLGHADVERLIEMIVAYIGIAGSVRLVVRRIDCDEGALATLEREIHELDLRDVVELIGDGRAEHYGALRVARVALALGQPLTSVRAAIDPLWFDVPVLAFDDPIVRETIEPCGLVIEPRLPLEIAAVVKFAARDEDLRRAMIAEGRRVRLRHAPESVSATVLETLAPRDSRTVRNGMMRR